MALQQTIELSLSSEIDNIINKGEVIFMKNPTVGLPEVFKLIYSARSKRQGDQKKLSFLEKKILHNRENGFTMTPINITPLDGSCYEAIDSLFSQFFLISENV